MEHLEMAKPLLFDSISGFHQYILTKPAHITFAGKSFCELIGYAKEEIEHDTTDLYEHVVHPADRSRYRTFITTLSEKEQTLESEYRIVCKDGKIKYVRDTICSKRTADGILIGISTLCDITALKTENDNLRFLNETIPCGFLKYTCDKNPKITYVNEQMLKMMHYSKPKKGELDDKELYSSNLYLMFPMEERRQFAHFLRHVYVRNTTIAGEIPVVRFDGTRAIFYGWVTKIVNEQGIEEFQSVCMDVTERYQAKRENEIERYVKALSEAYDKIFLYDFANKAVKYLYGNKSDIYERILNIPMHFEEATRQWVHNMVAPEDIERVERFFLEVIEGKLRTINNKPPKIRYRAKSSDGDIRNYLGIFLKIDNSVSFFCCKAVEQTRKTNLSQTVSPAENSRQMPLQDMTQETGSELAVSDMAVHAAQKQISYVNHIDRKRNILIRTFGYFDVFVNDKPIAFRNKKSKELLALLVDRRGGYVTSEEAIGFLWEDEPANEVTFSRYRKVALRLKNILEEYGIADIVEAVDGKRRIVTEKVGCDLYDYLSGREEFSKLFKGSYLSNYSWGEKTLGELENGL